MQLDERQAFDAMRAFLQQYFEETNGMGDVRLVLSDMEIEADGRTHDPAAWHGWMRAVETVLNAGD